MKRRFDANLPANLLDRAFPFHFALNEAGSIVAAGPRFAEIAGDYRSSESFFTLEAIDSPVPIHDYDALRRADGELQVVRLAMLGGILLRGEFMHDADSGIIRFLGHPWITDLSELADQGLGLADFPANAGVADLLVLLQARNNAVADMRRLNDRLKETSDELASRNEELERELEHRGRLEEQLLQSQKMEAIGQLASGVAHDFNNVLLAVSGHATLGLNADRVEDAIRHFESIIEAGDRAADITARLLVFARRRRLQSEDLDLADAVRDSISLLDPLLEDRCTLELELDTEPMGIRADPMAIAQVIVNLVMNARDAMPKGGPVSLRTRRDSSEDSVACTSGERPAGTWAVLEIEDLGEGIDEATMPRIFEPFFTTKELGEGTGLGLATVWWIIERSGGFIDVRTEVGNGTRFMLYLPAVEPPRKAVGAATGSGGAEVGPAGRMLFVEDDELVRRAIVGLLEASGWSVEAVTTGPDAVDALDRAKWDYDVVVTDISIPGLSGRELARHIHQHRPELPVVLVSGVDTEESGDGRTATLLKPFTIEELERKIRRLG